MKFSLPNASSLPYEETDLQHLFSLGPEAQGDVDLSLLEANLKLTPLARIEACQRGIEQVSQLREAMKAARHA